MTILHPSFEIVSDSGRINPAFLQAPEIITVERDIYSGADTFELIYAPDSDLQFQTDEIISISLGYNDENQEIIKGMITEITSDLSFLKIRGYNEQIFLVNMHLAQTYERQNAGDIVSDICDIAQVRTDRIDNGIDLSFYYLAQDKNCFEHIHDLARKNGYVTYMNEEGKLNFCEPGAGNDHSITYGVDLLQIIAISQKQVYSGVRVFGESPASSQGDDTMSWLTSKEDEIKAEKGDMSGEVLVISDKSLRIQEATAKRAEAKLKRIRKASLYGRLLIIGKQDMFPGDHFHVEDCSNIDKGKKLFINRIVHIFSKKEGFLSYIDFREA